MHQTESPQQLEARQRLEQQSQQLLMQQTTCSSQAALVQPQQADIAHLSSQLHEQQQLCKQQAESIAALTQQQAQLQHASAQQNETDAEQYRQLQQASSDLENIVKTKQEQMQKQDRALKEQQDSLVHKETLLRQQEQQVQQLQHLYHGSCDSCCAAQQASQEAESQLQQLQSEVQSLAGLAQRQQRELVEGAEALQQLQQLVTDKDVLLGEQHGQLLQQDGLLRQQRELLVNQDTALQVCLPSLTVKVLLWLQYIIRRIQACKAYRCNLYLTPHEFVPDSRYLCCELNIQCHTVPRNCKHMQHRPAAFTVRAAWHVTPEPICLCGRSTHLTDVPVSIQSFLCLLWLKPCLRKFRVS